MSQIRQLLEMPIYGNAFHDEELFNLAHEIIMGDNHISMKKAALRKIDEAVGAESAATNAEIEDAITGYIAFHNSMAGGDIGGEG